MSAPQETSSSAATCPACGLPLPVSTSSESRAIECPNCLAAEQAAGPPLAHESPDAPDDPHRDLGLAAEEPDQYDLGPSARYPQYFNNPSKPGTSDASDDFGDFVEIDESTGEVIPPTDVSASSGPPPLPPAKHPRWQGSDDYNLVVHDDGSDEYELDVQVDAGAPQVPTAPVSAATSDLIDDVESAPVSPAAESDRPTHDEYEIDLEIDSPVPAQPASPSPSAPDVAAKSADEVEPDPLDPSMPDTPATTDAPAAEAPPAEEPVYVPIVCRICRTRFYAVAGQIGQEVECPDCYAKNVVPPPEVRKTKPKPKVTLEEDHYQLSEPIARPDLDALGYTEIFEREKARPAPSKGEARRPDVEQIAPRTLPKSPFTVGVFDYPLFPDLRMRWVVLTIGLLPVLLAAKISYDLLVEGGGASIGGLLLAAVVLIMGAVWAAAAASCFLAIIQSTSEGLDDLGESTDTDLFDRAYAAFYVVSALMFSVVPGWLPMQLVGASPLVMGLVGLSTGWFLFPLALLSMLEVNSPFVPYSKPVWRSLSLGQAAWKTFYFETAGVALAAYFAVAAAIPTGVVAMIIAVAIVVGGAMIYFRLLGRLALVCADFMSIDFDDDDDTPPAEDEMAE